MQKPKVDPDLAYGLNFTPEDLAANREGYMTKKQRVYLGNQRSLWMSAIVLAVIACPILSTYAIWNGIQIHDSTSSRVGIIALICVVTGGFAIYAATRRRIYNADVYKGNVSMTEGSIVLDVDSGGRRVEYYVGIGNRNYRISKSAFLAFKNHNEYRLYYAPNSRIVLSAEPMVRIE